MVQKVLQNYKNLEDIIATLGMEELSKDDVQKMQMRGFDIGPTKSLDDDERLQDNSYCARDGCSRKLQCLF